MFSFRKFMYYVFIHFVALSFIFQKCDRSIDSSQFKYKQLKNLARKEISDAKRDLAKTGNKKLCSSTVDALRDTNMLQQLRSRMGATATGFPSKHCE